jgi:class 3 adenylate cyclase/tetratricopeptide (TPR) repeat protein
MPTCAVCGYKAVEAFKFCPECGAAAVPGVEEQRKVVTVLFCDVVGSTALGESTDPEAVRAILARYFERMKAIVERHGGTVEKFIGDAVMAVFGIPVAHEDDALRACRAAVEMREAWHELGVAGYIGIDTGEVVTGTEERLATGDAVNVAARLQQAAQPRDALIGAETLALVGTAVDVEAVAPLPLKGKAGPVPAYRLIAVHETPARRPETRFVGRERELAALHEAWERALGERCCELVTIVGEAGVGKSRLVAEALGSLDARMVQGRCLPYGDGITYWPVVEILRQLRASPSDETAAMAISSVLGETEVVASAEEIAWAVRKLLEEQAPLVAVFDDLQWGEETFLDLLEHITLLSSGASILLLAMARPELAERRANWPVTLRLEPLAAGEVEALIPERISRNLRAKIARTAGGNPLFVEEMVAMTGEAAGDVAVPPTLQALLAARLDQLDPAERRVLERGAVEGEIFHRGAVQALAPDETQVTPRLAALVRKGLIRPQKPQLAGEDGFRFRHLLIRDAAYAGVSKATRAELHERFAGWLDDKRALVELDELVGYHLEQATRYQAELGRPDAALALRAGDRLLAAGRRALDRNDMRAAAGLLERALSLTQPLRLDVHAELDLAQTLWQEPGQSARIAERAALRAREAGDKTGEALARALAVHYRLMLAPGSPDELETLLLDARRRLEETGDHAGLAHVWVALGFGVANARGRYDDSAKAYEQARHYTRLAGRSGGALALPISLVVGSRPADEALEVVDRLLAETSAAGPLLSRAWLLAMLDRSHEARQIAEEAAARLREQTGSRWGEWTLAELSTLAGDHEDASNHLRTLCEWLERTEQRAFLGSYVSRLGRSLCLLGFFDEAEQLAERAQALEEERGPATAPDSVWRQVLARVHAHRGQPTEAERLARDAVAESERTDSLDAQCLALWDLAEVLATAGRSDEAGTALEQALERCQRKKNLALARRVRERLVEQRAETQPAL